MSYRVIKDIRAESEIEEFARYAADYSDDWAREQFARLNYVFTVTLAESPITWNEFYVTGLPHRGYFLRIPTKPATNSNRKPATDSDLKPAGIPI